MKWLAILSVLLFFGWFYPTPAAAHDCGHHGHRYYGDCRGCAQRWPSGASASRAWAPGGSSTAFESLEGKIAEIVYLPGTTPDSGIVEMRVQSSSQVRLIRLAPAGFLKQSGVLLKEGDAVMVKGYPVGAMEGDLMVATEVHKDGKSVVLRQADGAPLW